MFEFFRDLFAPIERTLPTHPSCPPHGCPLCLHDLPCVNLVAEGANCEPPEQGWLRALRHETEMTRAKTRKIRAETEAIRKETQSMREQTEILRKENKRLEELRESGELKGAIQADIHRRARKRLDALGVENPEENPGEIPPLLTAWMNSQPDYLSFFLSQPDYLSFFLSQDKTQPQSTMVPSNTPQDNAIGVLAQKLFETTLTFKVYVLAEDADAAIRCATDSVSEITFDYDPLIQVQPCQSNTLGWDPEWHVFHGGNSFISLREVMPTPSREVVPSADPCDTLSDPAPISPREVMLNSSLYEKLIEARAKSHLEECEKEMCDPASRGYSTSQQAATFLYLHQQIQDLKLSSLGNNGPTYEEMRLDEQQERRSQHEIPKSWMQKPCPQGDSPKDSDPRLQSPLVTRLQGAINFDQGPLRVVPKTHRSQALRAALSMAKWLEGHGFGNAARFIERELHSPRKP